MIAHLRFALPLLLCFVSAGCNDGGTSPDLARRAAAAASNGAGPASPATLRIVALPRAFGPTTRDQTDVLVSDPALQGPRLLMDTGAGFVDAHAVPVALPDMLIFSLAAPQGARLQVQGTRAGAAVVSNVATIGARPTRDEITILSPAGRQNLVAARPVVVAPTEATWAGPQVDRFLVLLHRIDESASGGVTTTLFHPEQFVEVSGATTRLAWGDAGLASYRAGSTIVGPLPAGTWALRIVGLDAGSWAFATSSASGDFHEFEAR